MPKYLKRISFIALIGIGIIGLSLVFSFIFDYDSNLREGDKILITVASKSIEGHIYTIRGDGRYTVRYINNIGDPKLITMKRFEFISLEVQEE